MRRRIALALATVLLLGAAGCSSDSSTDEGARSDATTTTTIEATTTEPAADAVTGDAVGTSGSSYDPATLQVAPGTTVTFTNAGGTHSVTPDDAAAWGDAGAPTSDWATSGATYAHRFDTPGTYAYHCSVHGSTGGKGMAGVVVVG